MKRSILFILCMLLCLSTCVAHAADADILLLPNKAAELTKGLYNNIIVTKVAQITGEQSANKTSSRYGVWGTDLGSMTEMNGKVFMFGGDTFSTESGDGWRSNVLFIIEDDEPDDGLDITDAILDKNKKAKELLGSVKRDGFQVTVIPTDIFSVGEDLYCIYMSVSHWNEKGGSWECGYSGLGKSTDEGKSWKKLPLRWPGDSNFIQTAHCLVGDTMYFWGIPSGRYGGVALMKVSIASIENGEEYEYFTGIDENNNPIWVKGPEGIYQAKIIIKRDVGEISVIYNEYLGNFIITYLHEGVGIVMREGVMPWGEWSMEYILARPTQYPSLYGAFMCPKYVKNDGKTFYFAMSQYFPIYNIMWMKAELP